VLGESIHAVIVPRPESARGGGAYEEALRLAIYQRGRHVPRYQRLRRLHFSADELPRTLAGGIDRARVKQELTARLARMAGGPLASSSGLDVGAAGAGPEPLQDEVGSASPWRQAEVEGAVVTAVARVAGVATGTVTLASDLESDLHLDPLHKAELLLSLEEHFHAPLPEELVSSLRTVGDVLEEVKRRVSGGGVAVAERVLPAPGLWGLKAKGLPDEDYWLRTSWAEQAVRAVARRLMRLYARTWFGFQVEGAEHLPQGAFIVAANHCSHLDTGAVVTAFGPRGRELFIMGARDYFFNRRLKSWFFHTFLNVIPFDRSENVIEGLRLAQAVLRAGRPVLIYPEGRRSASGDLQPFKAGIGLLGVELGVPIVPCWIEGTHASLPKGRRWPRRSRVRVRFGAPVTMDEYRAQYGTGDRRDLWRRVAEDVRAAVERLRQGQGGRP
jgi:long-chain acyl-CoA synthetase